MCLAPFLAFLILYSVLGENLGKFTVCSLQTNLFNQSDTESMYYLARNYSYTYRKNTHFLFSAMQITNLSMLLYSSHWPQPCTLPTIQVVLDCMFKISCQLAVSVILACFEIAETRQSKCPPSLCRLFLFLYSCTNPSFSFRATLPEHCLRA